MVQENTRRYITRIKVNGSQKRYKPSRHYVYILQVRWSDGSDFIIYRRYSQFFDFHTTLLDMFPKESGFMDSKERVIPYLPGKIFFKRSAVQKVALEREASLGEYCEELLKLKHKISRSDHVNEFFDATLSDYSPPEDAIKRPHRSRLLLALLPFTTTRKHEEKEDIPISDPMILETFVAIADFQDSDKNMITLKEGHSVEVVDKNENGWWLVQDEHGEQGWAPAGFLVPLDRAQEPEEPEPDYNGENYIVVQAYDACNSDEISVEKNVVVKVLHKLLDGWWVVSYNNQVGYIPATSLEPYQNPHFKASVKSRMSNTSIHRPSPRRCTIKTRDGAPELPTRDLAIYQQVTRKPQPPVQEVERASEFYMPMTSGYHQDENIYANDEIENMINNRLQRSASEGNLLFDHDNDHNDAVPPVPAKPPRNVMNNIPARPPRDPDIKHNISYNKNSIGTNNSSEQPKKTQLMHIAPPSGSWRNRDFHEVESSRNAKKVALKPPAKHSKPTQNTPKNSNTVAEAVRKQKLNNNDDTSTSHKPNVMSKPGAKAFSYLPQGQSVSQQMNKAAPSPALRPVKLPKPASPKQQKTGLSDRLAIFEQRS